VPPEYDNLIAKLMVQAHDRDAAIERLARALDETEIGGVQTTVPFHRFVAASPAFRRGELSTGWVDEHWDGETARAEAVRKALLATGLAALVDGPARAPVGAMAGGPPGPAAGNAGWRHGGRAQGVDRWPR
jgi:acetyl/propionyl-CoA carboxylase alpha subunit